MVRWFRVEAYREISFFPAFESEQQLDVEMFFTKDGKEHFPSVDLRSIFDRMSFQTENVTDSNCSKHEEGEEPELRKASSIRFSK